MPNKLPYPYKEEGVQPKVIHKDEEGKVMCGPPNFYTNPPKKGTVGKNTFFMKFGYKEEDPDAEKKLRKAELEYHHSKLP